MPGYPYSSWIVLFVMVVAIASMPFIPGQTPGMIAGILMVASFACIYIVMRFSKRSAKNKTDYHNLINRGHQAGFSTELSEELTHKDDDGNQDEL